MKLPVMERLTAVPEEFEDHVKMVLDLMTLAFKADLTRVITLMMAREGSNRLYRSVGISDGHYNYATTRTTRCCADRQGDEDQR